MLNHVRVREESGATAVEFAFVAPIVVALLFATIEIGAMEAISTNLDGAVSTAARTIRTGADGRPTSNAAFKTLVCSRMAEASDKCQARLAVSVRRFADFASAGAAASAAPAGEFDGGSPGDIILVHATYRWPLMLPLYAGGFTRAGPNEALLQARSAFKNEPYE